MFTDYLSQCLWYCAVIALTTSSLKLFSDKAYECVSDSIIMFVFCRLSDVVEKEDVTEAIRLVEMSKQSLTHVEENVQRYGFLTIIHFIMK